MGNVAPLRPWQEEDNADDNEDGEQQQQQTGQEAGQDEEAANQVSTASHHCLCGVPPLTR